MCVPVLSTLGNSPHAMLPHLDLVDDRLLSSFASTTKPEEQDILETYVRDGMNAESGTDLLCPEDQKFHKGHFEKRPLAFLVNMGTADTPVETNMLA